MSPSLGPTYYWVTSLVFAFLLQFPATKLIWVKRVRSLERKLGRKTSAEERQKEKKTARLIAVVITFAFALLFNRTLLS